MKIRIEAHSKILSNCWEWAPLDSQALIESDKPATLCSKFLVAHITLDHNLC